MPSSPKIPLRALMLSICLLLFSELLKCRLADLQQQQKKPNLAAAATAKDYTALQFTEACSHFAPPIQQRRGF